MVFTGTLEVPVALFVVFRHKNICDHQSDYVSSVTKRQRAELELQGAEFCAKVVEFFKKVGPFPKKGADD